MSIREVWNSTGSRPRPVVLVGELGIVRNLPQGLDRGQTFNWKDKRGDCPQVCDRGESTGGRTDRATESDGEEDRDLDGVSEDSTKTVTCPPRSGQSV